MLDLKQTIFKKEQVFIEEKFHPGERHTQVQITSPYCGCSVAQSYNHIDCSTPHQASLSFTISSSLLKPVFIQSIIPSKHLIFCWPLLLLPSIFPSIRVFSNDLAFPSSGQSIGASLSASVLPINIQDWLPLGLTGLISLLSKGLSRVFSRTTGWKHQFFSTKPYLWSTSHFQ